MSGDSAFSPLTGAELDRHRKVQELAEDGGEVPERFICKVTPYGAITDFVPRMDIPVIDFSRLSSSLAATDKELEKLQSALSSWGCFQVQFHSESYNFYCF